MYTVWRRSDGHIGASREPGLPARYYPSLTFEFIGEYEEWSDALHVLLNKKGKASLNEHLAWNCIKCWKETPSGEVDFKAVFAIDKSEL